MSTSPAGHRERELIDVDAYGTGRWEVRPDLDYLQDAGDENAAGNS